MLKVISKNTVLSDVTTKSRHFWLLHFETTNRLNINLASQGLLLPHGATAKTSSSYPEPFWKDPGIVWSRDSTKINCPRGSGKVSNYMLENVTVNFKYQELDFTIHRSKRPLTSILYFCLLLNYKSTVAFYQQSSQETNKSYTLKFEVGCSLTNIFSYQTGQSSTFVYFRFYLFLKYAIYRFVVCKR